MSENDAFQKQFHPTQLPRNTTTPTTTNNNPGQPKQPKQIQMTPALEKIIDALCLRFLARLPEEDLKPPERVFFTIEQMHWFYLDFYKREKEKEKKEKGGKEKEKGSLPSLSLVELARLVFHRFGPLKSLENDVPVLEKKFRKYKVRVPVCGGVLLNSDLTRCLMVRGCQRSLWSFPAGKINKDETEMECAVREVLEETGFDGTNYVLPGDCIDFPDSRRPIKLFIMPGVSDSMEFSPKTRGEIEEIQWHPVAWLSTQRDYLLEKTGVQQLFTWIHKNRFNFARLERGMKKDEQQREEEEAIINSSLCSPSFPSSSATVSPSLSPNPQSSSPSSPCLSATSLSPCLSPALSHSPAISPCLSPSSDDSLSPSVHKMNNFHFDISSIMSSLSSPSSFEQKH